ncbi:hypothetical protein FOPG_20127 [Fusarium oxysporum f. sp. conglutinans race 2 54008]|uniref:Uncharacterized protein n=1 Tax=Fusarium oxysporum f. sp. conglutinans race 2 54008 TaxID=1089457 RepID=X0HQT7_FUSOX|nr:hypothetical protein FOPG_20127 [Fusarium oxysporum f. sp. conglutinans race 2 54008]
MRGLLRGTTAARQWRLSSCPGREAGSSFISHILLTRSIQFCYGSWAREWKGGSGGGESFLFCARRPSELHLSILGGFRIDHPMAFVGPVRPPC